MRFGRIHPFPSPSTAAFRHSDHSRRVLLDCETEYEWLPKCTEPLGTNFARKAAKSQDCSLQMPPFLLLVVGAVNINRAARVAEVVTKSRYEGHKWFPSCFKLPELRPLRFTLVGGKEAFVAEILNRGSLSWRGCVSIGALAN